MNLNYKSFGQGFPVVILHGLFGMLDNWQTIAKKLADNFSVYIIDLRNHGRSPHLPDMSYIAMVEDLQAFMEANWLHEAYIIGHSMGGKTAMQLALSYPDLVKKLIVVDIAPKVYPVGHRVIFDALLSLDLAKLENRKAAAAHLQTSIKSVATQQFLLKNLALNKEGRYEWKMNLEVIHQYYDCVLENVRIIDAPFESPTLFIKGGQSGYIQDEDLPAILKYFPNAVTTTIPEAGHWVHATAPARLLNLVNDFLAED